MATTLAPTIKFILQIKVTIAPENVAEFKRLMKPVHEAVLAEPECAFFFIGENVQEPGVLRWTEGWNMDLPLFMGVQIKKPYYEEYFKATEPMFLSERIAEVYTPVDGFNVIRTDLFGERVKSAEA